MTNENTIYEGVYRAVQEAVQKEVEQALQDKRICCMVSEAIKQYLDDGKLEEIILDCVRESEALRETVLYEIENAVKIKLEKSL